MRATAPNSSVKTRIQPDNPLNSPGTALCRIVSTPFLTGIDILSKGILHLNVNAIAK